MSDAESRFAIRFEGVTLLGRYVVGERLGEGGMATVYRGQDSQLGMPVVVKVPHGVLLAEPGFRRRFENEIQDLIALRHPHIVTILARGEHDEVPFLVQQYLSGGSLDDRLDVVPARRMPLFAVSGWVREVAQALDFMHARGIVHRDMKPANVLFDEYGYVYLSDFGIAKAIGASDTGLTVTGATPGSPTYMAPEQAREGAVAGLADQYALASTVYEALCGRPPFEGQNVLDVLLRKQGEVPPRARSFVADLPPAADDALARSLARDPGDRFPTCAAFADAFLGAAGSAAAQPASQPGAQPGAQPAAQATTQTMREPEAPAPAASAAGEAPAAPCAEPPVERPVEPPGRRAEEPTDLGAGRPATDMAAPAAPAPAPAPMPVPTETSNRPAASPLASSASRSFVVGAPGAKAPRRRSFLFSAQFTAIVLLVGVGALVMVMQDGGGRGERGEPGERSGAPDRARPTNAVPVPPPSAWVPAGKYVPDWAGLRALLARGGAEAEGFDPDMLAEAEQVDFSVTLWPDHTWRLVQSRRGAAGVDEHAISGRWEEAGPDGVALKVLLLDGVKATEPADVLQATWKNGQLIVDALGDRMLLKRAK